jgi:hypothetical protein
VTKTITIISFLRRFIMAYQQQISQAKPGFIGLVIDDSGSMGDFMPGTTIPKCKYVENYFGHIFNDLLTRSTEVAGTQSLIKKRYYLYIVKYGSDPQVWGEGEMDIETAAKLFANSGNSLELGGNLGGTDAATALEVMYTHLQQVLASGQFMNSYPPMIFHLSDGESATDATECAERIKQLSTNDGNVLMVNAYIGTQTNIGYTGPKDFLGYVDLTEVGPTEDNMRMFNMSSIAPECILQDLRAKEIFPNIRSSSRLFFDARTKETLKHCIQVVSSIGSRAEK